jgi:alpha 1,2-mannosyltransferase
VLYLDADNVPVRDPTFLIETPQYAEHGTILWPDYGRLSRERAAWRVFGSVPYGDEPEVESGQIVIDKARCRSALTLNYANNDAPRPHLHSLYPIP